MNLLYQVYDDMERKVGEHKAEREQEAKERAQDKVEVERRVKEYEAERQRQKEAEFARNRLEQKKLLGEISEKEEKRRLLLMELQRE